MVANMGNFLVIEMKDILSESMLCYNCFVDQKLMVIKINTKKLTF